MDSDKDKGSLERSLGADRGPPVCSQAAVAYIMMTTRFSPAYL